MAIPASIDARLFYRCAVVRIEEAEVLVNAGFTTGAVYLAGYAVECMLKALILSTASRSEATDILKRFHGRHAHDFEWLRDCYYQLGGSHFPREIVKCFLVVNAWSTHLRYQPKTITIRDTVEFMASTKVITNWAKQRL
jgi:hypothetical protein